MNRDSTSHTIAVTLTLAVACSLLVSSAAVGLRELQETNRERSKKKNILIASGLFQAGMDVDTTFDRQVRVRLIDLATGTYANGDSAEAWAFDQMAAARDPQESTLLDPEIDAAGIRRRENLSQVYLIEEDGQLDQVVLPIYGRGLYSTLYGLISLATDGNTVRGITYYEHGETPGLGGEVENPKWTSKWVGKKLYDEDGEIALELVKGPVAPSDPEAEHAVDAISGATMTSQGINGILHFWFGDEGFGPFLENADF